MTACCVTARDGQDVAFLCELIQIRVAVFTLFYLLDFLVNLRLVRYFKLWLLDVLLPEMGKIKRFFMS